MKWTSKVQKVILISHYLISMENSTALTDTNFGVVILCPDANSGGLKTTTNSIKVEFSGVNYVAIVGNNAHIENVKSLEKYCRVCYGGKTITSLIDKGVTELQADWRLVIMSGSLVRYNVVKKYRMFAKSEKDILYPVIDRKYLFYEASINGIFMSKSAYDDIGAFGDNIPDLKETKLIWATKALEKKYRFKAIVGGRFV